MECCNDCVRISALSNCPKHSMVNTSQCKNYWWRTCNGSLTPLEKHLPVFFFLIVFQGLLHVRQVGFKAHCTCLESTVYYFHLVCCTTYLTSCLCKKTMTRSNNENKIKEKKVTEEVTESCRVAHFVEIKPKHGCSFLSWRILVLSLCSKGLDRGGDALSGLLLLFYLVCVLLL